uniref:NADH-ubiquinone oxidoreductase chain 1 n=1 Tax=Dermacentor nitens TaxID=60253 RepID=V9MLK1_DERNI|nr:NADH dehydrogenase subunit 1 [Dermacentor nitens]AGH19700.1 NADH dehydrogenase subunit 1 [Dermacentor nitens]
MLNFIYYLMLIIMVLLSIAFFTLMERKILGYCHMRKGPNKAGIQGLFQPFSDAMKLFSKEMNYMFYMNISMQIISPLLMISLMMMMWMIFYYMNNSMNMNLSVIFLICVSSLSSYAILFSGWASNSKYSLIGSYRGFAQVISYEVSLAVILISISLISESFNMKNFIMIQWDYPLMLSFFFIFVLWIFTILAETNRVPFDLAEGESELVSGFNIEYGSWLFAIIFMSEYGSIMLISYFSAYLFLGKMQIMELFVILLMMMFVLIRSTYVRVRYDQLMMLAWKIILPQSIIYMFLMFFLLMILGYFICIIFWNYKI